MALRAPFRKCVRCGTKLPAADGHSLCVLCLGEAHVVETCHHCQAFSKQTRRHRSDRLKAELWKRTLLSVDTPNPTGSKMASSPVSIPKASTSSAPSVSTAHNEPSRSITISTAKKLTKKAKKPRSSPDAQPKKKKKRPLQTRGLSTTQHPPPTAECSNLPDRPVTELLSTPSEGEIRESSLSPQRPLPPPPPPRRTSSALSQDRPPSASQGRLQLSPRRPSPSQHRSEQAAITTLQPSSETYYRHQHSPRSASRYRSSTYGEHYQRGSFDNYRGRSRSPPRDWDRYSDYHYPSDYLYYDRDLYFDPYLDRRRPPLPPSRDTSAPPIPPRSLSLLPQPQEDTYHVLQPDQASQEGYQSDSSSSNLQPSLPSPSDEVGTKDRPSPSEDMGSFSEQVLYMATALGVDAQQHQEQIQDPFFDNMYTETSTPTEIPFSPILLQTLKQTWESPSLISPTSRRLESMYRVQSKDVEFLFSHPKPNSIIVESSHSKSQKTHSSPVDKEGRRLDFMGRRAYSASALGLRVTNYQALMARYQAFLWDKMGSLCDYLPDDQRELARAFQAQASRLSKLQTNSTRHQADCYSKLMTNAVALRRHAWLRSAGLTPEARSRIESLPFDGDGLFNSKTDEQMDNVQKARTTAKKMGIGPQQQHQQQSQKSRRWPRQYQPYSQRQSFDRSPRFQPSQTFQRKTTTPQNKFRSQKRGDGFSKRRF